MALYRHHQLFPYSDEDGTTAARMPAKVPAEAIAERHHAFMTQQKTLHARQLKRWVGTEQRVLVEEQRDFDAFACRHYGQAHDVDGVTIVGGLGAASPGDWRSVRITGVKGYDLIGEPA